MDIKLTRTVQDRMVGGVCGGIARYFSIDPVIVRLLFVVAVLAGGASPLIYLLLWIIIPEEKPQYTPPVSNVGLISEHPRPVEQWKYDPQTGERLQ